MNPIHVQLWDRNVVEDRNDVDDPPWLDRCGLELAWFALRRFSDLGGSGASMMSMPSVVRNDLSRV